MAAVPEATGELDTATVDDDDDDDPAAEKEDAEDTEEAADKVEEDEDAREERFSDWLLLLCLGGVVWRDGESALSSGGSPFWSLASPSPLLATSALGDESDDKDGRFFASLEGVVGCRVFALLEASSPLVVMATPAAASLALNGDTSLPPRNPPSPPSGMPSVVCRSSRKCCSSPLSPSSTTRPSPPPRDDRFFLRLLRNRRAALATDDRMSLPSNIRAAAAACSMASADFRYSLIH